MECGVRGCVAVFTHLMTIGLSNGAVIALNAIGVTLVYSVVRMINFAYGDLFALTTVLVSFAVINLGLQPGMPPLLLLGGLMLTLAVSMGAASLMSVTIERIAFRPFRGGSRTAPLIATIGISFMLYRVALLLRYVTNRYIPGEHRSVPGIPEFPRVRLPELLPDVDLARLVGLPLNVEYPLSDLLVVGFAAVVALLVNRFMQRSRAGRALRACAQDPEMAQLCGVNRNGAIRFAFAVGGALAGISAFVFAIYYAHPFTIYGAQSGLTAFTAAVLGGIGRPRGAFVSGLLLGVVAAFSDYFLAAQWTPVLLLTLLVALLVFRPTGLAQEDYVDQSLPNPEDNVAGQARDSHMWRSRAVLGGLLALGLAYPLLDQALGLRMQPIALSILIFALLSLGLNLVLGFGGLLDLGFAACFAMGAYMTGLLTMPGGRLADLFPGPDNFVLVLGISAATAAIFGALNGLLTLRLRGEYLAITTLAFGQIVPQIVINLDHWTGGSRGMSALPPPNFSLFALRTPIQRYYLALALVLLAAVISLRLSRSRIGRALAALSADETAAMSCGVPSARTKCLAFIMGAALAGVAGALFASGFSYVDPNQYEFRTSAMILAMVVIGGAGSVPGAIIGALIVAGYDQLIIPLVGAWFENLGKQGFWFFTLLDLRTLNFLSFGLALYLTMLVRARRA